MAAGFAKAALLHLIIDLREVRDGERAVHEVIKYLTKDVLPDRTLVPPDIFARVYESLDGETHHAVVRRLLQEHHAACGVQMRGNRLLPTILNAARVKSRNRRECLARDS